MAVGVVNPTSSDWDTLYAISQLPNNRVTLVPLQYSTAQLASYRASIEGILDSKSYDYLEGVNDIANLVEVHIEGVDAALAGQIANAGVPTNAFVIDNTFSGEPTHTKRDQWTGQYEAGLRIWNFRGSCTTGYMGYDNSSPRKYYGTTAGHCFSTEQVYIGSTSFNVDRRTWANGATRNSDSERFYTTTNTSQISYRIYTGGNNGHRDVVAYYPAGQLYMGTRLCFQGVTSDNNNCGNINARDFKLKTTYGGATFYLAHAWCMNYPSLGGDSGGPVYHVNSDLKSATAAGETHGRATVSGVNSNCFSAASYVMSDMGLTFYRKT